MNLFPMLAQFNAWVNAHIYASCHTLSEDEYRKDRGAFFHSIHGTLNHILVVDRVWFGRLTGTGHGIESLDQTLYDDTGKLREARRAEDEKIIAIVGELSEEDFTRPVTFQTMGNTPRKMTGNEILMSVFNHQTHHRGQVTAMLAQAGADYGDIDIPFFLEVF